MTLVLKICGGNWANGSRDKRELSVYKELGCEVAVLAKGNIEDKGRIDFVDGYKVFRYTTRPFSETLPKVINRFLSLFIWARFAQSIRADVITGHDLLGLYIGWISNLLGDKKAMLIYDSHEFELGRNANRNKLKTIMIKFLEGFMIKRSVFTIITNESVLEEFRQIYPIDRNIIVVRNVPHNWKIDEKECLLIRKELLSLYGE